MSNLVSAILGRCAVAVLTVAALSGLALSQTFSDSGFTAETAYAVSPYNTVGFLFAPDGRIFTWEKPGVVRVVKNGTMLSKPFLDISSRVNTAGDRGLIGFALDPDYTTNGYVYVTYVYEPNAFPADTSAKTERLSRFTIDPANPDTALPGSEKILLGSYSTAPCSSAPAGADCLSDDSTSHTIDSLRFGADKKLYVSIGDGASFTFADVNAFRAQDLNSPNGKILRLNTDGTGPADNPFFDGNPNSTKSKVLSYGLRNPFSIVLAPDTGELFIGEVGWNSWEEINRGSARNFGWPCYEGSNPNPDYQNAFAARCALLTPSQITQPAYTYSHLGSGAAVTVGAFLNNRIYPASYAGSLLIGDYVLNQIRRIAFDASGNVSAVSTFATGVSTPVHMEQGPDGYLYYLSIGSGLIKRLRYSSGAPIAIAAYSRPSVADPYTIAFSSAGSVDPAGGALSYLWDFGDGTTSTAVNPVHTYTTTGVQTFTTRLTVTNLGGASSATSLSVLVGSRPPVATITSPATGTIAKIGDVVSFTGTASDPDESLSPNSMSWVVLLHHNEHVHPEVSVTGSGGSFVVENHGSTGETFFYEIALTVTDSTGIATTARVNVQPQTSTSTLPSPWQGQEVGEVSLPGQGQWADGTFTVSGSGKDIDQFNDGFYFVYQKLIGDGQIVGRIASVVNTAPGAKAGFMIRESLAGNGSHAFVSASPVEGIAFERRDQTGWGTNLTSGGYFATPRYLKLVRAGNTITGYHSADGISWTLVSTTSSVVLPNEAYIGIAVTSANNAALTSAVVDSVSLSTLKPNQPPTVSLTSPATGASYSAPASFTLAATASDSDGKIATVEFYRDGTLIATSTTAPYQAVVNGLAAGVYSFTAKAYDDLGAVTTSVPVAVTVNAVGTGLQGSYYKDSNFASLVATRLDATINFNWGYGSPMSSVPTDHFSVRWTGTVAATTTETYTYYLTSTDPASLYLNDQLVLSITGNADSSKPSAKGSVSVKMTANSKTRIRVDFKENDKTAAVKLEWQSPTKSRQVIPTTQLFPQ